MFSSSHHVDNYLPRFFLSYNIDRVSKDNNITESKGCDGVKEIIKHFAV